MDTITEMLLEPVAHSILDSGGISGRAYQKNQSRDFAKEPQARWHPTYGVTVSLWHHLQACLDENIVTERFNSLPEGWNGEHYGTTSEQCEFLELIGADVGDAVNSYNWENNFDQVVQYCEVKIAGERYVLLQVHGGADVRGGYTTTKLFHLSDADYWMDDTSEFCVPRARLEALGYPHHPGEYDYVVLEVRGSRVEAYDPNTSDQEDVPSDFEPEDVLEGTQRAVEH